MFLYELSTSLTLNIGKNGIPYLYQLADLWCLKGRCLPILTYIGTLHNQVNWTVIG